MRTRAFFLTLLLCSGPAFAQSVPDFSGVFLRKHIEDQGVATVITEAENPLVLDIKQGADTLRVTEIQHGMQATDTYDLRGRPTINVSPDGMRSKDRAKFSRGKLVLKSAWTNPRYAVTGPVTEQTWEFSPDLQTLTIQPKIEPRGRLPQNFRRIAIFTRQTSLRAALEEAQGASGMIKCNAVTPPFIRPPPPNLSHGVVLGYTAFEELVWQVEFEAHLGGDFFSGLKRTDASAEAEFRKNGQLIHTYDGFLTLEVIPIMRHHPRYLFSTRQVVMGWGERSLPEWLLNLRFRIKWVGSKSRDLGEVPSELGQQPWPEVSNPPKLYRIEIPAHDVPLTDSLEIHILSAAGTQLGCISGHI
jgi:hypothetical protein